MSSLLAARLRLGELEEILGEWCADFGKDTKTVRRLARLGGTPEEKAESAACDRLYEVLKKNSPELCEGHRLPRGARYGFHAMTAPRLRPKSLRPGEDGVVMFLKEITNYG